MTILIHSYDNFWKIRKCRFQCQVRKKTCFHIRIRNYLPGEPKLHQYQQSGEGLQTLGKVCRLCSPGMWWGLMCGESASLAESPASLRISLTKYSSTPAKNTEALHPTCPAYFPARKSLWILPIGNTSPVRTERLFSFALPFPFILFIPIIRMCGKNPYYE